MQITCFKLKAEGVGKQDAMVETATLRHCLGLKNKNAERIKKDEEELQELLKAREEGTTPSEEIKDAPAPEKGEEATKEEQ